MEELLEKYEQRIAYLESQIIKYEEEISSLNTEVKRLTIEKYHVRSCN